ncbi:MAG: leucine-rich repeat domain-containing protein, partial [Candidatus Electrothrix sp. LOE1_4_5]|nr:leucine-rich repeat domain-containing protein [Candidatus Electrothrix gigas]
MGYEEAVRRIEEAKVSWNTKLVLIRKELTKLPSELFQLINLRRLYLSSNLL